MTRPSAKALYQAFSNRAQELSEAGFGLRLQKEDEGFSWVWLHQPSGLTFEGYTSADTKPVALAIALENAPVVSI